MNSNKQHKVGTVRNLNSLKREKRKIYARLDLIEEELEERVEGVGAVVSGISGVVGTVTKGISSYLPIGLSIGSMLIKRIFRKR